LGAASAADSLTWREVVITTWQDKTAPAATRRLMGCSDY